MRSNLRRLLVVVVAVAVAAAWLAVASISARRDKQRVGSNGAAQRAVLDLPRRAQETSERAGPEPTVVSYTLAVPNDGVELFPVSAGEPIGLAGFHLVPSSREQDLLWEPPAGAPLRPHALIGCWGFDWDAWLWEYKFPSGDLLLNPEVLDSVRPPK